MTDLVVVGAGVAGLTCAAIARMRGLSVTVVEAGESAGGMWKSVPVTLGGNVYMLDEGLRLPVLSGIVDVDNAIFNRQDFAFEWTTLDGWPREGGVTASILNAESSCLDATRLGNRLPTVIEEMRNAPLSNNQENALAYSRDRYGATLTASLIGDAVMGLFDTDLKDLAADAVFNFIPRRIILGDGPQTAELLADNQLAGRVAHVCHADLPASLASRFQFPKTGGVSTWINALHRSLEADGVTFMFNDGLNRVRREASQITALELNSGRSIRSDRVISSIAPAVVAMAIGAPSSQAPKFMHLGISHVLIDRPPAHGAQYVLNFDRRPSFFRAIFHDNICSTPKGAHIVTFEHLILDKSCANYSANAVSDSIKSGALAEGSVVIDLQSRVYRNAIPVPTVAYNSSVVRLRQEYLDPIENLSFIGRAAGAGGFLNSIIHDALGAVDQ